MEFRLANIEELSQLQAMYKNMMEHMSKHNIKVWDEVYPCDFLEEDIKCSRLYVLIDNREVISAFALCESNLEVSEGIWENQSDRALYLERFGVHTKYLRKGIGSLMIRHAIELSKNKGAHYLRLFVVNFNQPAINFYKKNGFKQAEGSYDDIIDGDLILNELGFEIKTQFISYSEQLKSRRN